MPNSTSPSIVIFDSGIGGLSIYQSIKERLPKIGILYCADLDNFPYGTKSKKQLIERSLFCLNNIINTHKPKLIIIACNSASTTILETIRQKINIPIIGVVPAIKTACTKTKVNCIGLLATPVTIKSNYTQQLLKKFAQQCQVYLIGSIDLVYMAEQYLRNQPINTKKLQQILEPFFLHADKPDCIVLGCTHFPLLKHQLHFTFPAVTWVDSGKAIAKRAEYLLIENNISSQNEQQSWFTFTGENTQIIELLPSLTKLKFSQTLQLSKLKELL